ncbi:MAG TPA: hypothetical protein VJZ32_06500 [Candidatus Bathyarchaeia archaeon]|nr:hypothetical protein [Candidatus Bathyarchaeia archaeon]
MRHNQLKARDYPLVTKMLSLRPGFRNENLGPWDYDTVVYWKTLIAPAVNEPQIL